VKVVGSYAELKELSGVELEDYHRPWIDDVSFTIDSVIYHRVDKVLDCWFESGSMPFAQFHYPFENKEKFEANFPGDFIAEYVGQVRAWFYYLHAVNVGLFGKNAFKNVVVTGTLAGNDGRKMSKSYGNYTDPNELMDQYSADALRFLLLSSPVIAGEDFSLLDKDVADVNRKLAMIWNMYDFFTLYADVDGWEWDGALEDPSASCTNTLDIWIVSRLHQLIAEVTVHMDRYDLQSALKPILPFIDDASNWYVRRSRKRFWKSEDDGDKQMAYKTLHYVLVQLAKVLAPFTPFLAEELYRNLTGGESVHLLDWPVAGHINELALAHMQRTRDIIQEGLSQRAKAGIKVRQPLLSLAYFGEKLDTEYELIIGEEVNVQVVANKTQDSSTQTIYPVGIESASVVGAPSVYVNPEISPELKREGMSREVIRAVQNARKEAGLEVDDRIHLELQTTDDELLKALEEHAETIHNETLATPGKVSGGFEKAVKVEGVQLTLQLKKA
jgi:isoleucyl-tRNA synthetase